MSIFQSETVCYAGEMPLRVRPATLADILPLRHAILRPGLPLATAHFDGDNDPTTIHLAAVLDPDDAVVGCATLMARPYRDHAAWQLRGMATRADLARRGVGRAVLAAVEELVRERGGPLLLWCNARRAAVPFYQSGGWRIVSEEFEIAGVGPHHVMMRELT